MRDHLDLEENADPTLAKEPWLNSEPNEAMDPIESAEPTDPIDSTEPTEPIERKESSDHNDHLDDMGRSSQTSRGIFTNPAEEYTRSLLGATPSLLKELPNK